MREMITVIDWGRFCSFFYFIVEMQIANGSNNIRCRMENDPNIHEHKRKRSSGLEMEDRLWLCIFDFDSFIYVEEKHETFFNSQQVDLLLTLESNRVNIIDLYC